VIQARCTEPLSKLVRQSAVIAEHDAFQHRRPLAVQPAGNRVRKPSAQPVASTADPSAAADATPHVESHHDVDPVAAQPRALVESVFGGTRRDQLADRVEDRALRRRTPER
jgi:hypothetical protein